jgi:hypothetical protein
MADEKNVHQAGKDEPKKNIVPAEIDQLNLETARINHQLAQAALAAKQEELIALQERNEEAKAKRARLEAKRRNERVSDERLRQDRRLKQAYCNHSQGGEGLEGMYQGEGLHTTYQLETALTGHQFYRCVRCEDEVHQAKDPKRFAEIKKLPHKGLKGPVPILFKWVDARGNTVIVDELGNPLVKVD